MHIFKNTNAIKLNHNLTMTIWI